MCDNANNNDTDFEADNNYGDFIPMFLPYFAGLTKIKFPGIS